MTTSCLEIISAINDCEVEAMQKAGRELDPSLPQSCEKFRCHVRGVQAMIVYNYKLTAYASVREPSPEKAAKLWEDMISLCDKAIQVLCGLKDLYPGCGTAETFDLALDYRGAAQERYLQDLEDSKCRTPTPVGLFPRKN